MPLRLPSADPQPLAPGLYRTDAFHRLPLFAVAGHVVGSWDEAHALHGPADYRDVNPAYVAALITGHHNADVAPYSRIRRLPRAHHVLIDACGRVQTMAYDPLAGGAEAMDPATLHQFLRQGLLDHIQEALHDQDGAIACEHSSGLDSNAVLGALVHGVGVAPGQLHTWSHEQGGEATLLEQFRPFHHLRPDHCHRLSVDHDPLQSSSNRHAWALQLFGAPPQIVGMVRAVRLLQAQGCTLLFSGFGGDQALSHGAANVPTDLVAQGRWRDLVDWMGGRRLALKTAAARALGLRWRSWAVRRVLHRTRTFCSSDLLTRTLTAEGRAWLGPHLKESYPWEIDGYLRQHHSIRQRVLADWVAVRAEEEIRLAAAHGMQKAFPLLDERMIGTLLRQDPLVFGEGHGRGRLLHRKAFAPFLPPVLRDNPSKCRLSDQDLVDWRAARATQQYARLEHSLDALDDWHPALGRFWDLEVIRRTVHQLLECTEPSLNRLVGVNRALETGSVLSGWWQALYG